MSSRETMRLLLSNNVPLSLVSSGARLFGFLHSLVNLSVLRGAADHRGLALGGPGLDNGRASALDLQDGSSLHDDVFDM